MKPIESIEKLTLCGLEAISNDTSIQVPEGLSEELSALIGADSLLNEQESKKAHFGSQSFALRFGIAAAAALILFLGISLSIPKSPKDTYSDPYLAYAQVQEAFSKISQTSSKAAQIAGKAAPVIQKTDNVYRKY